MTRSPITTHVLDTARGRPAARIALSLERQSADGSWSEIGRGDTDADGRNATLLAPGSLEAATYRLNFELKAYFERLGSPSFYPRASIVFEVTAADEHYHVPLLLSPYGYSTYRGS